ncbi:RNA-directed DNA polymerase, eukaryota, reverse transcriptase zinc-binding domain protein, partial [Tanacetum coccineum]
VLDVYSSFNERSPILEAPNSGSIQFSSPISSPIGFVPLPGLRFQWAWKRELFNSREFEDLSNLVALLSQLNLSIEEDSWEFTVGATRKFLVKDMRSHITSLSHPWTSQPNRWNNSIPSKVNINTWRAMNSRLPTRTNLDLRGMDLDSIRCAVSVP